MGRSVSPLKTACAEQAVKNDCFREFPHKEQHSQAQYAARKDEPYDIPHQKRDTINSFIVAFAIIAEAFHFPKRHCSLCNMCHTSL